MSTERAQEQADATASRVLSLYALYVAGSVEAPDFETGAAVAVFAGKVAASRLADITVSTLANRRPLGIVPSDEHVERLSAAVRSIVEETPQDEPEKPVERLERLAEAETLLSHRASLHAAIRDQGYPEWIRVHEDENDPCEVCAPHIGEVQSIDKKFVDHPGCKCSLLPFGEPSPIAETESPVRQSAAPVLTIRKGVSRG